MAPILREFSSRSDPAGTPVALRVGTDEKFVGALAGPDPRGRLRLDADGTCRTVSIRRFLGLPQTDGDEA